METTKGTAMPDNSLTDRDRLHLERLKLAADVLLSECDDIPDSLEVELTLFRVIFSSRVSQGCDLRRPVVDSVADGTLAA